VGRLRNVRAVHKKKLKSFLEQHHTTLRFDHTRERTAAPSEGFIRDKVIVRGGDIARPTLATPKKKLKHADDMTFVINSAGNVTSIHLLKAVFAQT
jgi:hypothetical protein